jgi:succinate-semialdehyde dehydrogenase / glutarate-semialdehyde dehydrogenase
MNFGYHKLYIDGELVDAENKQRDAVTCPATGEVIAEVAKASSADAEKALDAAQKGFKYWSKLSLSERTEWMTKLRTAVLENEDLLRQAMVHEMGKTYEGAWEDIEALTNSLDWYPNAMKNYRDEQIPDYENTHTHKMVHQPAGVAVAYVAWNFPLLNAAFKIGPALAAGCSLILKPSDLSPLSAYILGKIMCDINFPAGVVNIISGEVEEVAKTLSKSKITRVITMIGSTQTALKVIADSTTSIKRLSMELGGNAPFIIFDDADFDTALNLAIGLKFGNSGQICVAANRIFVHKNIYNKFLDAYVKRARELKLGFGKEAKPDMGPVITKKSRERIFGLIEDAVANGAKIETGGKIPAGKENGSWMEPTVISGVTPEMRIYNEEIFGPVAPIISFETDDEVLKLANDTEYGLASYIFTNKHKRIQHFSEELEFGEVQVNGVKYAIYLPHGGIKNSGVGFDCSHLALEDYLVKKRITVAK